MLESSITWLALAYLAIGTAFAGLADHCAIRDLPAWYRRERVGWLTVFGLLWPLCLGLMLLCWRQGGADCASAKPQHTPASRAPTSRHHKTVAAAGPVRWHW